MKRVFAALLVVIAGAAAAEPARDVADAANAFRGTAGLPPLAISPPLEAVAEAHARDMARKGFFSHTGSDGSNVGARARRDGYRFCLIAENIAKGQKTAGAAMKSWIASPGHRRNMTLAKAREIGVARSGDIWVMVIATRQGGC